MFRLIRLHKNRQGFSLVEVLIALIILAVVLLGILYTFLVTSKGILKTKERERAVILGLAELEKLEGISFDLLPSSASPTQTKKGAYSINSTASNGTASTIKSTDISAEITVTVTWGDPINTLKLTREVSKYASENAGETWE